ncbi:MAG TPA: iron uptake system protein EfeO [Solirubrobacterales bacterium]|nr:iron uptake system protein EfeO [Solirubrobacterales bacterium]
MPLRSKHDDRHPLGILLLGFVLLAASAVLLAACGSDESGGSAAQKIAVEITDEGCQPTDLKAKSGPATFTVTNTASDVNNEFEVLDGALIVGERENLVAGLSGDVSVNLDPGTYDIVCGNPGNREPTGRLVVTGGNVAATTNPGLSRAVDEYADFVVEQSNILERRASAFVAAVKAGNVPLAKRLYETSRIPYEKIEPVAESFGTLDPAIDARENDIAQGDPWTGYHPLEKALWATGLTAADDRLADQLLVNIKRLQKRVKANTYDPVQLANGAVELLNEVSQSKVTGEEERYSHIDLTTFKANVDGAKEAFDLLEPELKKVDPDLAREIEQRFNDLYAALDKYQVKGDVYENYSKVNQQERRELSQKVDALAQPLALMGGQIVTQ